MMPNGTQVRVGYKRGTVIAGETVQAVPSGVIDVYTVELTHKLVVASGKTMKLVALDKPESVKPHHDFIRAL